MFAIAVTVMGEKLVHYKLSRFADEVTDWRECWRDLLVLWKEMEKEQFDSEGARSGEQWKALSDKPEGHGYASHKAKVRPGAPILYFSGDMREAITEPRAEMQKESMSLYASKAPYWQYHQSGTEHMPARQPIRFTEADLDEWRQTMHHFVYDAAHASGMLVVE